MQGELGRLAHRAGEEEQGDGRDSGAADLEHTLRLREDLAVVQGAEGGEDQEDPQGKSCVAHPGGDKGLLARVGRRIAPEPEADEQVRAQPYQLPAHEEHQEVVGQHQDQH